MAKIKLSSIGITNISGKAGGSVYSRNRGGSYVKNFVMPSNTITDARQAVRAIFGALASAWRTLTDLQRQSFTDQAPNYQVIDVFGDSKVLSGNALYQKLNTQLINAGLPQISDALAPQGANGMISVSSPVQFDVSDGEFTFAGSLGADNDVALNQYVLEATPPMSPSVKNVTNRYRKLIATTNANGTIPTGFTIGSENFEVSQASLGAVYIAQFGSPVAGEVIYARVKAVNPNTGEESAYFYFTLTAVA